MMTPTEQRNERLGAKMMKQLQRRHFEAYYCATADEARQRVNELIPDGSSVTWGGTMTVRDMGIPEMLKGRGTLDVWDRDTVTTAEEKQEMYFRAFHADYYLSSANAISEDGVIVNIDGNGNRVAAITWGPQHVIFVVGMNKVAQDVEAALKRARSTASPINAARFDIDTPCQKDGVCHNCNSPQSICNYVHFLRNSSKPGRIIVVLVGETFGY
jgi:L-lactate utilization protein LutB